MQFWQVDAFTHEPFRGNAAAVVQVEKPLSDETMQKIAMEMNLSETAFIQVRDGQPLIQWFTPKIEMDLCGHATLAAAHVYLSKIAPASTEVVFATKSVGNLRVKKSPLGYTMDFPARPGKEISVATIPEYLMRALSTRSPKAAYLARDLMLVYDQEDDVRNMRPDFSVVGRYDKWIIVTSRAEHFDFVSRFFCAGDGIDEDPVTGSAHCTLAPYWAKELQKNSLRAYQASERGGFLQLQLEGERVLISGEAVTVCAGTLLLP